MSLFALFYMIFAYLLGSISSAILICKVAGLPDPRKNGSHNPGATNVLRIGGRWAALAVLICDILKGMLPVWAGYYLGLTQFELGMVALGACLGHIFPIFFQFKGGKGVATSLGVLLIINWQIGLICLVFALLLMALTRFVSLGSVSAAILFPVLTIFIHSHYILDGSYIIFALLLGAFVVFNHRANVKRLLEGKENKLSFKGTK